MQYIVICLKDKTEQHPATYVQPSRKRYTKEEDAIDRTKSIAPSRNPVVVEVPEIELDEKGYPILQNNY